MRARRQRETEILRVSEAFILPPKKCVRGAGSRGAGPRECGCGGGSGSGRRRRPQTPAATQIVAQKGGGDVTPIRGASIMTECVAHLQPTRLDACNVTAGCMQASIKRGPRARKPNAEGVRQTHVLPENEPLPQFMSEFPKPTSTSIHLTFFSQPGACRGRRRPPFSASLAPDGAVYTRQLRPKISTHPLAMDSRVLYGIAG